MKLETFFEKFDQFADAPNAVAKMRELVLQLAVQGKLVRHKSDDEPAADLIRNTIRTREEVWSRPRSYAPRRQNWDSWNSPSLDYPTVGVRSSVGRLCCRDHGIESTVLAHTTSLVQGCRSTKESHSSGRSIPPRRIGAPSPR